MEARQDFTDPANRRRPRCWAVESVPKYLGYEHDPYQDELILVDGWQIGGTYHCADRTWASYGPAAYTFRHPNRQAAIDVQVTAYRADPLGFEQQSDVRYAERQAEHARLHAEIEAERARREAERRRARLGDDEPGRTILTIPAYHALYAPTEEAQRVGEWLGAHGLEDVSGVHEIRVEQRANRQVIVYEAPRLWLMTSRGAPTETYVTTLTVQPPAIDTPARPDLHELIDEHWPTRFPLIDWGQNVACPVCTLTSGSVTKVVPWPCEVLTSAITHEPEAAR